MNDGPDVLPGSHDARTSTLRGNLCEQRDQDRGPLRDSCVIQRALPVSDDGGWQNEIRAYVALRVCLACEDVNGAVGRSNRESVECLDVEV